MELNELKRELSKLSGVDFFNPKYRDVFKKFVGSDTAEEPKEEIEKPKVEETPIEEKVEDIKKAEDEREVDKIEETKAEEPQKEEEKKEEVEEESEEIGKDVDELKEEKTEDIVEDNHLADELLDAKIELELIHNGVTPENVGKAKKMAKYEITNLEDLDKVAELLKEYPEWVRGYKPESFGMTVDEDGDGLTQEERRLKEIGIDPRN